MTVIHRDLSRLEKWAQGNLMRVSKGKCRVLQLCRRKLWGSGGQRVEDEPAISSSSVQKANSLLDCVNRSLGSRPKKVITFFYFSTFEVISRLASPVWGFQHNDKLEQVQRRDTNMTRVYKGD